MAGDACTESAGIVAPKGGEGMLWSSDGPAVVVASAADFGLGGKTTSF